jgi:hypothetical protein
VTVVGSVGLSEELQFVSYETVVNGSALDTRVLVGQNNGSQAALVETSSVVAFVQLRFEAGSTLGGTHLSLLACTDSSVEQESECDCCGQRGTV